MDSTMTPGPDHPEQGRFRVDPFDATARAIGPQDRGLLHELTIGVFWPHRADDLDLLIALGRGYLALDDIGRPLGAAMHFYAGDDFAMLGMMATAPRLQTLGTGRRLLHRIMADCAGRDLRLSATRTGRRLYESEGFVPEAPIWQHQGQARAIGAPDPVPGLSLRGIVPGDATAVCALDRAAYGADRGVILHRLLGQSEGVVAERDGAVRGFALIRRFGRGRVIGPLVAEDETMAIALAAPLIARYAGHFLRLDVLGRQDGLAAFLKSAGLEVFDTITEMRIGPQRRGQTGAQVFGLAAHTLG